MQKYELNRKWFYLYGERSGPMHVVDATEWVDSSRGHWPALVLCYSSGSQAPPAAQARHAFLHTSTSGRSSAGALAPPLGGPLHQVAHAAMRRAAVALHAALGGGSSRHACMAGAELS